MKPKANVDNVLRALAVGPSTADELAYDLGGGVHLISAVLHNLRDQSRVVARPYHAEPERGGCRMLYSLPEHVR